MNKGVVLKNIEAARAAIRSAMNKLESGDRGWRNFHSQALRSLDKAQAEIDGEPERPAPQVAAASTETVADGYEDLTKKELAALAKKRGITVGTKKKSELIEALRAQ